MKTPVNMQTLLFPTFAFLGIVLFACDRRDKRKIELEKAKAKAEWDRASECFRDDRRGSRRSSRLRGDLSKGSSPFPWMGTRFTGPSLRSAASVRGSS